MAALPGGPLEICFSFDTTQSMTSYIDQVKARLQSMVQRLQADIPAIRIALCAHGDHYQPDFDNKSPYVMLKLDFTDNLADMCQFIQKADPTFGGDWQECYEYVLREARESLGWSGHTNKVFVLIGDARPHTKTDNDNIGHIDWKLEVDELVKKGVTTYGIYCNTTYSEKSDRQFFRDLAKRGGGSFLQIEDFEDIFDTLMAICYREHDSTALQLYEDEVKSREQARPSRHVNNVFSTLKKSVSNASMTSISSLKLTPVVGKRPAVEASSRKQPVVKGPAVKRPVVKGPAVKRTVVKRPAVKRSVVMSTGRHRPLAKQQAKATIENTSKRTPAKQVRKATVVKTPNAKPIKSTRHGYVQPKLRREKVPESNFILRELPWSSWRPAFCSTCLNKNWVKRKTGVGYRARELFKRDRRATAIYEFSVRSKIGSRKIVVSRCTVNTQSFSQKMEAHFQGPLKTRLDNILRKDCVVFVRRLILGKSRVYKTACDSLKLYSYLWETNSKREYVNKYGIAI